MLIIKIQNDSTGTPEIGNYRYQVMVNERVIERGEVKGHRRSQGWQKLVALVLENSLFMMARIDKDGGE
jgi:outer membrane usher protein FimD/PapC